MNPEDLRAWQDAVLDEVFLGIAASEPLVEILTFKGARILARHLPEAARQSLDIDANCSREFLANYPDRQVQASTLQGLLSTALRRHFESASPVRYQLDELRVTPKPQRQHPRGWNAFEVNLRVADLTRASQRSLPALGIDIAHPETLTDASTTTLDLAGHGIRAYTLHRIAGEKVRAFLSSLPEYQAKIGRSGGIVRAKDLYDLARILRHRPSTDAAFWRAAAGECRVACESRFVDCAGWSSFSPHEIATRAIYEREPTIPGNVSFDEAWLSVREIVGQFEGFGVFPLTTGLPPLDATSE